MKRGFVYDIFPLFSMVILLVVAFSIGAYLNYKSQDILNDSINKGMTIPISYEEYELKVFNPLNGLDFVIPLFVAVGSIVMIVSGYLSQSPATVVILFIFVGIIGMTAIVYLNEINTGFFNMIQSMDARVNLPYTFWVINNLPMILGATLLLTGLFIHSKTAVSIY